MAVKKVDRAKVEKFLFNTLAIEHSERVEITPSHINVWSYKRDAKGTYVVTDGQPQVQITRIEYDAH